MLISLGTGKQRHAGHISYTHAHTITHKLIQSFAHSLQHISHGYRSLSLSPILVSCARSVFGSHARSNSYTLSHSRSQFICTHLFEMHGYS